VIGTLLVEAYRNFKTNDYCLSLEDWGEGKRTTHVVRYVVGDGNRVLHRTSIEQMAC
jgi:hypothetical protein